MKRVMIFVGIIFLLVGCGFSGGNSSAKKIDYNFKQGASNLEVKLFENAPPERIFPFSKFKIIAELDNQAAYDILNGKIQIAGINERYFTFSTALIQDFERLEGRSLINPQGGKTFIEFDGQAIDLYQKAEQYVNPFFIKTSFDSTTEFADTICLNPKLYTVNDGGCDVKARKTYSGQGSPLGVAEMEQVIAPGVGAEVEFRFTIRNKGMGKVGSVTLTKAMLGKNTMNCEFQRSEGTKRSITFRREKQESILICRSPLPGLNSFTTTVALDFTYDYEMKEQHRLTLVK